MNKTNNVFLKAFSVSSPIFFAYFPMGFIFGLLFENEGYYWLLGPIMSFFVYAGAMQFTALSLLDQGAAFFQIFFACCFISIRNSFYGPAFFDRFEKFSRPARYFLIFGLVDATYGLLLKPSPVSEEDDQKYCVYLSGCIYFYWLLGSIVGTVAGTEIPQIKGLEFVLMVLFAILAIDQYYKLKKMWPFATGLIAWILMLFFIPKHALLGAILFSIVVLFIVLRKGRI